MGNFENVSFRLWGASFFNVLSETSPGIEALSTVQSPESHGTNAEMVWSSLCCWVWVLWQQALLPIHGAGFCVLSPKAPWTTVFLPLEILWAGSKHHNLAFQGGDCVLSAHVTWGQNGAASPAPVYPAWFIRVFFFFLLAAIPSSPCR